MYPNTIDSFRDVTGYVSGAPVEANKLKAGDQNNMAGSVEGIMTELGTLPKGSYGNVKTRLNNLLDVNNINIWRDYVSRQFNGNPEFYTVRTINVLSASNIFFGSFSCNARNDYAGVNDCMVRMYFYNPSNYDGTFNANFPAQNDWRGFCNPFSAINVPTGNQILVIQADTNNLNLTCDHCASWLVGLYL